MEVARILELDPDTVFKTLVTRGKSGEHYVFMIPVACELDLKKAANVVNEKAVAMIRSRELLPLTGYVHGGCSPLGMKKPFPTAIDETCQLHERIAVLGRTHRLPDRDGARRLGARSAPRRGRSHRGVKTPER